MLCRPPLGCLGRHEEHGDAVMARFGQINPMLGTGRAEEGVGHLDQDAGAVTSVMLAADRAAVVQVGQHGNCLLDDLMGLFPLDIGDEADAAGIVLELGIVKPLFLW